MPKNNEQRSNTIALALIVIATIAIVVSAYKIYSANKSTPPPSQAQTQDNDSQDIAMTTDWLEAKSQAGGFSMKIPNGWNVQNYAKGALVTDQIMGNGLVFDAAKKAEVTNATTSPSNPNNYGIGAEFNTFLIAKKYTYDVKNSETATVTAKTVTRGGLSGKLTTVKYDTIDPQLSDTPQSATYYVYVFPLPEDKTLVASYVRKDGAPDQTKYFDQAVRTIQINK